MQGAVRGLVAALLALTAAAHELEAATLDAGVSQKPIHVSPPLLTCAEGCVANGGVCDHELGLCRCPPWLTGAACSEFTIPACELQPEAKELHTRFMPITRQAMLWNTDGVGLPGSGLMNSQPITCRCLRQVAVVMSIPPASEFNFCFPFEGTLGEFLRDPIQTVRSVNATQRHNNTLDVDDYNTEIKVHVLDQVAPFWRPLEECPGRCRNLGWCSKIEGEAKCYCFDGYEVDSEGACEHRGEEQAYCPNMCSGGGRCLRGFCHCRDGFWGLDCSLTVSRDGASIVLWDRMAAPGPPPETPRIYVYQLAAAHTTTLDHFDRYKADAFDRGLEQNLRDRLLASRHRTADIAAAEYFFLPASGNCWGATWRENLGPEYCLVAMFREVQRLWPAWNETQGARHIITDTTDGGLALRFPPVDFPDRRAYNPNAVLGAIRRNGGRAWPPLPASELGLLAQVHPLSPQRKYIVLQPMGLHQRYRRRHHFGSFRPHQDINVPCPADLQSNFLRLSFAYERCMHAALGTSGLPPPTDRMLEDFRMSLTELAHREQFDTARAHCYTTLEGMRRRGGYAAESVEEVLEMRRAVFCPCVEGRDGGWGDRCWKAVVAGCLPVLLQEHYSEHFDEVLPWDEFAVRAEGVAGSELETRLRSLAPATVAHMRRQMFAQRNRLLWSSIFGSYLHEDASDDAFATLMQVLRARLNQTSSADGGGDLPMKALPMCPSYMAHHFAHNPFLGDPPPQIPTRIQMQCGLLGDKIEWPAGGAICARRPHGTPPC